MGKAIFEFDIYDDKYDIELVNNRHRMHDALDEIYNMTRTELKHGEEELSDHIDRLLESIQEKSWISTDFD